MTLLRKPNLLLGVALGLAGLTSPVHAASEPSTRLVRCDPGNCLLVSGHRDNVAAEVRINGQPVTVEGGRNWRARVPVATVRDWSAPMARTIAVSLYDAGTQDMSSENADLPIGLMGHADLASLVVSAQ